MTFKIDLVPPVAELPRPSLPGEPPPQPWVPLCGQGDSLRPEPQSTAIDVEKERTERERGRPAAEDRQTPLCTHQAKTTGRGRWPISRLVPFTLGVSRGGPTPEGKAGGGKGFEAFQWSLLSADCVRTCLSGTFAL